MDHRYWWRWTDAGLNMKEHQQLIKWRDCAYPGSQILAKMNKCWKREIRLAETWSNISNWSNKKYYLPRKIQEGEVCLEKLGLAKNHQVHTCWLYTQHGTWNPMENSTKQQLTSCRYPSTPGEEHRQPQVCHLSNSHTSVSGLLEVGCV